MDNDSDESHAARMYAYARALPAHARSTLPHRCTQLLRERLGDVSTTTVASGTSMPRLPTSDTSSTPRSARRNALTIWRRWSASTPPCSGPYSGTLAPSSARRRTGAYACSIAEMRSTNTMALSSAWS